MFQNLKIDHNAVMGYDVVSFDLTKAVMEKFWSFFGAESNVADIAGSMSGLSMWDGEEGIWMGIHARRGVGCINLSMSEGRLYVDLMPEHNPLDCTEILSPQQNWIRFAPILRWIKEFVGQ